MGEDKDIERPPKGMFRVIGYDQYDYSNYLVGDYPTLKEVISVARERAGTPNAEPSSFSDIFFVYDHAGECHARFSYGSLAGLADGYGD